MTLKTDIELYYTQELQMKKILVFLLAISLVCIYLCGCGNKQNSQAKENNVSEKSSEESALDENEMTVEEDTIDDLQEVQTEDENDQTLENTWANNEYDTVPNNGGNFIKIGDCVYYIKLTENALNRTVLFGEFRDRKLLGKECALMCYDTKSGESSELTTVVSDTRLAYYDGYIYTGAYQDDYVWEVWRVNVSTGEKEVFQYARLLYIDPETGRIVTIDSDENGSYLKVYAGTNLIHTLCVEDPAINVGEVYLKDEYLIYELQESVDADDGPVILNKLCSANIISGEGHFLGILPERDDPSYPMYGSVDQLTILENKIYIAYGYYAGTGNFLNERHICVADLNQDDSIAELDYTDNWEGETDLFLADCLPEIVFSDVKPYDVSLNYDTYYLQLFLPGEDGRLTAKDLLTMDGLRYGSENRKLAEVTEYVDGKVYMIIDEVDYNPDESIGWRDAYDVNVIHYYELDVDTGELKELEPASEFK